jgi:hypothetical protein
MMSIGFLAELITAYQGREEDGYSVAEQTPRDRAEPWLIARQPPTPTDHA